MILSALVLVAVASASNVTTPSFGPATAYAPRLPAIESPQLQVGPVNPPPAALNYPVNFSFYFDVREATGKWKATQAIGAVGADVWVKPLSAQWSVAQNGWAGGTVDGGAAIGTGFGLYWRPLTGLLSAVKLGICGGVDAVAGQKAGLYAGFTALGTVKF